TGRSAHNANKLNNHNNYSIENQKIRRVNYQAIVDYDLTIASNHNIHLMGGYQFFDYEKKHLFASTRNLYVNDNPSLNFTSDPANKSHSQHAERSEEHTSELQSR